MRAACWTAQQGGSKEQPQVRSGLRTLTLPVTVTRLMQLLCRLQMSLLSHGFS